MNGDRTANMRRALLLALVGALTFLGLHLALVATWSAWFDGGGHFAPWFMNSVRSVEACAVVFALVGGCVSTLDRRPGVDTRFASGAYLALGALVPMVAVLFTLPGGPGTLFPIAVVTGWAIVLVASTVGACLGWAFGRFGRPDS